MYNLNEIIENLKILKDVDDIKEIKYYLQSYINGLEHIKDQLNNIIE